MSGVTNQTPLTNARLSVALFCYFVQGGFNFESTQSTIDVWLSKTKIMNKYYNLSLFLITERQRTFEVT